MLIFKKNEKISGKSSQFNSLDRVFHMTMGNYYCYLIKQLLGFPLAHDGIKELTIRLYQHAMRFYRLAYTKLAEWDSNNHINMVSILDNAAICANLIGDDQQANRLAQKALAVVAGKPSQDKSQLYQNNLRFFNSRNNDEIYSSKSRNKEANVKNLCKLFGVNANIQRLEPRSEKDIQQNENLKLFKY